ncbi:catalase [Pseudoalteromonas sp. NBT06-2]|uniref:putative metalloprotease CJM1_0395 family protein n=1 Tax=Pseudoalteromonas sp. NBT06-2 TaxID=2025950 RepID=UPI000BA659C9|nr:putative metalloprotease CJM1_0395 family protein [Pseudoalteromonas sp. NBT06-2]PAJ73779.1 catalase [Pseudoalteromonas sp. NBT06-2]
MNIVTTFPTINLNTANVHTETARRDNQNKELVQEILKPQASPAESKLAGDSDKAKQPGQSVSENQEILLSEETTNKKIEEDKENESQKEEQQSKQQEDKEKKQQNKQKETEQTELEQVKQLKSRDTEVRNHEHAHAAVGGEYAGSPSYEYQRGPDGNNYAVGGEVPIDIAVVANDPQATINKMQQVQAAALAPTEPSSADRAIAADAAQKQASAQAELAKENSDLDKEKSANDNLKSDKKSLKENTEEQAEKEDLLLQRDTSINERAARIADFYQAATSPFTAQKFAQQI